MTKELLEELLDGGRPRSIDEGTKIIRLIDNQRSFDALFELLFHENPVVVRRAADAVEKISLGRPEYLKFHKTLLLKLFETAEDKEVKWHLAQLVSRLELNEVEFGVVWQILSTWAMHPKESRIVRTNSIHALFDLLSQYPELTQDFLITAGQVEKENIPSINARMRKLKIIKRDRK